MERIFLIAENDLRKLLKSDLFRYIDWAENNNSEDEDTLYGELIDYLEEEDFRAYLGEDRKTFDESFHSYSKMIDYLLDKRVSRITYDSQKSVYDKNNILSLVKLTR